MTRHRLDVYAASAKHAAHAVLLGVLVACGVVAQAPDALAQTLVDTSLSVATVVGGLNQPIAMALCTPGRQISCVRVAQHHLLLSFVASQVSSWSGFR